MTGTIDMFFKYDGYACRLNAVVHDENIPPESQ